MFDFNTLIPRMGQARVVCCPDGLCNAEVNGERGVVAGFDAVSVTLYLQTGRYAGHAWGFGVGHTQATAIAHEHK